MHHRNHLGASWVLVSTLSMGMSWVATIDGRELRERITPASSPNLTASVSREVARFLTEGAARPRGRQAGTQGSRRRPWIARHPALFGAVIGAGGGMVLAVTTDNELFCLGSDEDCLFYDGKGVLVGAGIGAGIGSLVGWALGLAGR